MRENTLGGEGGLFGFGLLRFVDEGGFVGRG
jgi:hypothetical protein